MTTSVCCPRHFNCEPSCTGGICFVELRNGRHLLVVSQGPCHL
ncbi:C4-dicarboxylate transport protein [Pseudomonas mandelii JR-1]|uniref:C4-dicarboxylate transport protein n=1 Tax=Pseudomonas mandelii JR-1 TaxID=1147786 RepID=A0A024EHT4_9PSED|nr:C4-dicarboxylate transport protein [Pseudomonas mandelii JR-1]